MGIKVTVPNTSSDTLTFGSANTPTAAQIAGIDSGSSNGQLALYTTASGTSTERMRIDSSGNVGIGTASPSSFGANFKILELQAGSSSAGGGYYLTGNGTVTAQLGVDTLTSYIGTRTAHPVAFTTTNTERMRIDSSGCLVVNSTAKISNTTYLSVQGSTAASNIFEQKDTGTSYASGNYYQVYFNSSNAVAGGIAHNAAGTVAFNTSSDARLKENIVNAPSVLDKVLAAQVRSFDWKEDKHHVEYGFIAQELYNHLPEAVGKGDDADELVGFKGTWQVEYGRLTPMLIKAIQEQQAIITSLTDRITALEAK